MGLFDWFSDEDEVSEVKKETPSDFSDFQRISEYIYDKSGITDLDKRALISKQLMQFSVENELYTTQSFLEKMRHDRSFYQDVINIVTVNETYFMREIKELEWLISYIKHSEKNLKILSMPCSSGEEVYSILILLSEANIDISKIDITGFDINTQAVKRAQKGIYDERALHKIPLHVKEKYFTKDDERYHIDDRFKRCVHFYQNNIFDLENYRDTFDIVLSRNMFIYFDSEKRLRATNIIIDLLNYNGIYIKGHADHIQEHEKLENLVFGVYKKV
ncbi:MAG: CheR family methyltransferase [Campylobacterota bacterium]|nr:CheR family methyltransferase [Campylobacterota bacterium]